MNRTHLVFLIFLNVASMLIPLPGSSQSLELYQAGQIEVDTLNMPFRLLVPKQYNANKKYPLIVFLHGSGERGNDNQLQLTHGAAYFASDSIRDKYPAFVLFPQCPPGKVWHNGTYVMGKQHRLYSFPKKKMENPSLELVEAILKSLHKEYNIDNRRIYIGGLSIGGMGTFEIVRRNPRLFAAAFPICGGANPDIAKKLKGPDWWIFHGEADDVVPAELSVNMFYAIKERNPEIKLSIYEGVKHDSWTNAFNEPGLMEWLFSKRRN